MGTRLSGLTAGAVCRSMSTLPMYSFLALDMPATSSCRAPHSTRSTQHNRNHTAHNKHMHQNHTHPRTRTKARRQSAWPRQVRATGVARSNEGLVRERLAACAEAEASTPRAGACQRQAEGMRGGKRRAGGRTRGGVTESKTAKVSSFEVAATVLLNVSSLHTRARGQVSE